MKNDYLVLLIFIIRSTEGNLIYTCNPCNKSSCLTINEEMKSKNMSLMNVSLNDWSQNDFSPDMPN